MQHKPTQQAAGAATRRAVLKLTAAAGALALTGTRALAQAQGAIAPGGKPIRMIVAVGAGGATDVLARTVGERMAQAMAQPVVVENMPAASGAIAAQTVARAAPDGTTLLIGTNTTHASNQVFIKQLSYDPIGDFEPVALLGRTTLVLCVDPKLPVKNVQELIAHAKANPGKLEFASGTGSARMAGEMFKDHAKIDILSVPYRSNAQGLVDLIGGRIAMIFGDMSLMLPHIKAGAVRALAVAGAQRSPLAPDLPTVRESGLPNYQLTGFIAAFAPARTPAAVVSRLNLEMNKVLADGTIANSLLANGIEPARGTPQELQAFVAVEAQRWADIGRAAGIQAE